METKELQKEIDELNKISYTTDLERKEYGKKEKQTIIKILELLENKFILRIETWSLDKNLEEIFKFLKEKKIDAKKYKGDGFFWSKHAYGIETTIDKNTLINNLEKLFSLFLTFEYQFEDSSKIITIDHHGDLKIG